MKRIIITGSSGYLGSRAAVLLAAAGHDVHGIDVAPLPVSSPLKKFFKISVTDFAAMSRAFEEVVPDVAVHLAFVVKTTHNTKLEEDVAINGSRNFLACVEKNKTGRAVFLSSVAAYGAFDDNDVPLTENSRIRGVEGYGYSRLKAKVDGFATEFMRAHPECEFVLLRPCLFAGPNTDNNFFDVLKFPVVPQVKDKRGVRDPEFQFIHEDDMAECLVAAIEKNVRGVFNVAGEGTEKFSGLVKTFGKRCLPLPAWLLYPATKLLWKARLVTSPPAQLDFIRYPWVMDCRKMRAELYQPKRTSVQAFHEFARRQRRSWLNHL